MIFLRESIFSKLQRQINFKTAATLVLVLTVLLWGGGCDSPTEVTDPFEDAVKVDSDDGLVSLLIPAGSAPEGTNFSIEISSETVPEGSVGKTYKLGPEGIHFDPPARLIFNYQDTDLPPGITPDNLAVGKVVQDYWLPLYTNIDEEEKQIKSPVGKLSTFSLIQVDPEEMVDLSTIKTWTGNLYEALEDEQDLVPAIEDILSYFSPIFTTTDNSQEELIFECIYEGVPFFVDYQVEKIASGYSQGMMVEAQSYFDSMNQAGFEESTEIGLLYSQFVWANLQLLVSDPSMMPRDEFYPHEVLPALLFYLSDERVDSYINPWGDEHLDPLQFTLLNYALNFAAVDMSGEVETALFGRRNIRRAVVGWAGRIIGVPTSYKEAAKECLIAPQFLYSYLIDLEAQPELIYKKQTEKPSPPPYESQALVQVSFYHETGPFRQRLLDELDFELPENGPQADKPVEWTLQTPIMWRRPEDVDLAKHGDYSSMEIKTDEAGMARATYTAEDEIDEKYRDYLTADTGHLYVRIKDLMLGRMRGVERAVVALNPEVGEDRSRLTVNYYLPSPKNSWAEPLKPPHLDL